jgi:hypothetical protein
MQRNIADYEMSLAKDCLLALRSIYHKVIEAGSSDYDTDKPNDLEEHKRVIINNKLKILPSNLID